MRLSCGEHSFLLLSHEAALDLIAALGFEGVNVILWGDRSHVGPDEVRRDVASWAGRLDERIRGRGLEVADVVGIPSTDYRTLAVNHPDRSEREQSLGFFRDMVELTARLGAGGLTILPGIDWEGETHEESLARTGAELVTRVAEAEARGVSFSIEPHVGSVCRTPADVAWLCEFAPGLQLTLDYTHFVIDGYPEAEIEPLLARTRHFHARGGAKGRLQTPLAESTIDYERVVGVLHQQGYAGHIAVEYVWLPAEGMTGVDVLSETILMRDLLRARFATLS